VPEKNAKSLGRTGRSFFQRFMFWRLIAGFPYILRCCCAFPVGSCSLQPCHSLLSFPFCLLRARLNLHSLYCLLIRPIYKMRTSLMSMLALGATMAAAAPAPSRVSQMKRATSCTFTSAASASASKKSCTTIVLDNIEVPAGETLDLTDLTSGTKVRPYQLASAA